MFCPECGEIPEDSRFCLHCAAPVLESDHAAEQATPAPQAGLGTTPPPYGTVLKRNRTPLPWLLTAIALLLGGALAVVFVGVVFKGDSARAQAERYLQQALAHYDKGEFEAALEDFDLAIRLDKGYDEAYNGRGWASYKLGDCEAALEDFDQAIALNPDYADAYAGRGWTYYAEGDYETALSAFDDALDLDPSWPMPTTAEAGSITNRMKAKKP